MGKKLVELKRLPPEREARSKIIGLCNNKGGVGKTSLTIAFGLHMVRTGHNVLFVDCDSQRNLTQRLGLPDDTSAIGKTKIVFGQIDQVGDSAAVHGREQREQVRSGPAAGHLGAMAGPVFVLA